MTQQSPDARHGIQLNVRYPPETVARLDVQAQRFGLTISSLLRIAVTIGLETLETLKASGVVELPPDPGASDR